MEETNIQDDKIKEQLSKLQDKYEVMGQDISSYLDGLLYSNFLSYWDYIHLDTLLSLQNPRTDFPDEEIFIMYHQITELYFKLCLHEINQIIDQSETISAKKFLVKIQRMGRYFNQLKDSFEVMVHGMEKNQFLKFRMALLPSSGFQSVQYRMIEIMSTDLINLVEHDDRLEMKNKSIEEKFKNIYWKKGAVELATGKKTLTLEMFEKKYQKQLMELADDCRGHNIWTIYSQRFSQGELQQEIETALKEFDELVNVHWPLAHLKSAGRYLQKEPKAIEATGGTNWQKYLPPRFQKRIFYPQLWSEEEIENWGRAAFR